MLHITIQQSDNTNLSFSTFEQYELPAPVSGVNTEINGDVVLKFEDEQEAVVYAEQLENLSNQLNNKDTPQYQAINDIIMSIRNDEFVQGYLS